MRWGCREQFSRQRLQMKPLVSDLGMHHGTCVTHVPWCMSGSLNGGGGVNVPGIPGACATHNITYLARGPWCRGRRIKSFHIYSWKKGTVHHPKYNEIASHSFFTTFFNTNYHCPLLTFRSWFCVGFVQWSCFVNVHFDFYRRSVLRCFGVSEKHIYWFITICGLSVRYATLGTWCLFTSHWGVARTCDSSRCCKSIWCAQT